jgi:energy-coupling factor transport system substrate-specific component
LSGAVQGAGAELVFAAFFYRAYGLPVALLAGVGAAIGEWLHDMPIYYPDTALGVQLAYGAFMLISGVLIAGLGSWLLVRALVRTGVLSQFPSGREQPEV